MSGQLFLLVACLVVVSFFLLTSGGGGQSVRSHRDDIRSITKQAEDEMERLHQASQRFIDNERRKR